MLHTEQPPNSLAKRSRKSPQQYPGDVSPGTTWVHTVSDVLLGPWRSWVRPCFHTDLSTGRAPQGGWSGEDEDSRVVSLTEWTAPVQAFPTTPLSLKGRKDWSLPDYTQILVSNWLTACMIEDTSLLKKDGATKQAIIFRGPNKRLLWVDDTFQMLKKCPHQKSSSHCWSCHSL